MLCLRKIGANISTMPKYYYDMVGLPNMVMCTSSSKKALAKIDVTPIYDIYLYTHGSMTTVLQLDL
jgi:hypothetical protein